MTAACGAGGQGMGPKIGSSGSLRVEESVVPAFAPRFPPGVRGRPLPPSPLPVLAVSVFCLWGKRGRSGPGRGMPPGERLRIPPRPQHPSTAAQRISPGPGTSACPSWPPPPKKGCQKNAAFWSQAAAGMRGEIEMEGGWTPPLPVPRHCLVARPLWEGADALSLTCGLPKVAWEVTGWPKK